jgi:hypothetical protein
MVATILNVVLVTAYGLAALYAVSRRAWLPALVAAGAAHVRFTIAFADPALASYLAGPWAALFVYWVVDASDLRAGARKHKP